MRTLEVDQDTFGAHVGSISGRPFYCVELYSSSYGNWPMLIASMEIETPRQAAQVLSAAQSVVSAMTNDAYMSCGCVAPGMEQSNAA